MRILALANQKGGCGKTTITVNLASALAQRSRKVLVIDLDPQAHATTALGIEPSELPHNMYDVLAEQKENIITLDKIILEISKNLYLAPAAIFLSAIEQELSGVPGREDRLSRAISNLKEPFRYILIDCPPSLGLLTFNALKAAKEVLIPIEPSSFSLRGLDLLLETIELLESASNHKLLVYPVANNLNLRTKYGKHVLEELNRKFGEKVFNTIIPPSTKVKEAAATGLPVDKLERRSNASRAFSSLAWEIIALEEEAEIKELEKAYEESRSLIIQDGEVIFTYKNPEANTAYVVGDFNNWTPNKEAHMQKDENGVFKTKIKLEPGKYQYRFIVDGRWIEDPENPNTTPAPFGGVNSVLEIPEKVKQGGAV